MTSDLPQLAPTAPRSPNRSPKSSKPIRPTQKAPRTKIRRALIYNLWIRFDLFFVLHRNDT